MKCTKARCTLSPINSCHAYTKLTDKRTERERGERGEKRVRRVNESPFNLTRQTAWCGSNHLNWLWSMQPCVYVTGCIISEEKLTHWLLLERAFHFTTSPLPNHRRSREKKLSQTQHTHTLTQLLPWTFSLPLYVHETAKLHLVL